MNLPERADHRNFEIVERIGKGAYGHVYRAICKIDRQSYALKEMCYRNLTERGKQDIVDEVNIIRELSSDQVVKYYGWFTYQYRVYIILEYCTGRDLDARIREKKTILEPVIWRYLRHILQALNECLRLGVVHRDVKPSNIMLSNDSAKLGDFGLACHLSKKDKNVVGTPYYMAPEVYHDPPMYSEKSDIWSLGCVVYEMACLRPPFVADTESQLKARINRGLYDEIPSFYTQDLRNVIRSMLTVDPCTRPCITDLLKVSEKMKTK